MKFASLVTGLAMVGWVTAGNVALNAIHVAPRGIAIAAETEQSVPSV